MAEVGVEISNKIPMFQAIEKSVEPALKEFGRIKSHGFDEKTEETLFRGAASSAVKRNVGIYISDKLIIPVEDIKKGLIGYVDNGIQNGVDKMTLDANINAVLGPLLDNSSRAEEYKDLEARKKLADEINGYDQASITVPMAVEEQPQIIREDTPRRMGKQGWGERLWNYFKREEKDTGQKVKEI